MQLVIHMVQTRHDEEKGMQLEKTNQGECCELSIRLVPVHPLLSSMTVFYHNILAVQNALLGFFQGSHRYCFSVGVTAVVLSSKSDAVAASTYILPLTIIFTHLLISSIADF